MATIINASPTSGLTVTPDSSGVLELQSNGVVGASGTLFQGTAINSTSGTSIEFTGIPSWAKRITVMLNGVSTNGSSNLQIQIGSGSYSTTGYSSQAWISSGYGVITSGLILTAGMGAGYVWQGYHTLNLVASNTWIDTGMLAYTAGTSTGVLAAGASPSLGGALDRIRVTTINGTDTFDAGKINIHYEG